MNDSKDIDKEIEKAIIVATSNMEIEEDMKEVSHIDKEKIVEGLVHDEEIREKALKKVYVKNDV